MSKTTNTPETITTQDTDIRTTQSSSIDFEQDRVQSVTQVDTAKTLSDKVIELKNLEDEIKNAEQSLSKLKEQAR